MLIIKLPKCKGDKFLCLVFIFISDKSSVECTKDILVLDAENSHNVPGG